MRWIWGFELALLLLQARQEKMRLDIALIIKRSFIIIERGPIPREKLLIGKGLDFKPQQSFPWLKPPGEFFSSCALFQQVLFQSSDLRLTARPAVYG
jgi:hypothetical protein